ncbi:DUF1648 domain-containing protein [Clostridium sp. NSJ-49]|uniref:DUF5808 domain-containing protein n=1 Tax=Bacteria TaxID=2 RepID=UPI00164CAEC8|nr:MULTISPECIES: DUF5808 domain-containing protein [Bacteria]MBC5626466.1 DUF1648 domain-containing protein [Clostridium sp. NSJ-49]MCD2500548.1 DUF5808 domain-containing protein [Clostridium sp. NSJ-145]MDU6340021.1 DUF5808 domain-containing protein [Clostridium sp.]MDY3059522.1 DUF5808 domain-containing protein [Fusobacterium sp.]
MEELVKYFIFPFITIILYIQVFNLNRFSNNGIYFGIRVPLEYKDDKDILELEKIYKKQNIILILPIIILVNIIYFLNMKMWLFLTYIFILIGIINILPIIYWIKMRNLKNKKGWKVLSKNVVIVETGLRQPQKNSRVKAVDTRYYLILLIIPLIISILTLINYNSIPQLIPVHYNVSGVVDKVVEKGTIAAYMNLAGIPFMLVLMIFFFMFINNITVKSKSDLFSGKIKETIEKKLLFKKYVSIFTWILALETLIIMAIPQICIIFNLSIEIMTIPMIILFISIVIFLVMSYYLGQGGRNIKTNEEGEENYRDDDDKYILGALYYNKKDPALMVEKRIGVGWTVNLAHPLGKIVMILPFIIIVGMIIFMYFYEKTNPIF